MEGVKRRYDRFAFCEGYELVMNELKAVCLYSSPYMKMNLLFNEQHPWTLAKEEKSVPALYSVL